MHEGIPEHVPDAHFTDGQGIGFIPVNSIQHQIMDSGRRRNNQD